MTQLLLRTGAHRRIANTDPLANKLLLSSALQLVLTATRSKGKYNMPYLYRRPFSKLISLLMFIDAIPWQGGLISLVGGVLPYDGGPRPEERSG